MGWDNSVGIVTRLFEGQLRDLELIPRRAQKFSLNPRIQTGSGVHLASYPMETRGSFPSGKAARSWSWPLTFI
jgi:hypothetical protein